MTYNLTKNYLGKPKNGKQEENNLILMMSKERLLNDKQSLPFSFSFKYYLNEKEIFTCKHVIQDNSALKEYILKL